MLDKKEYKTVNFQDGATYIEKNEGTINYYSSEVSLSEEDILFNISNASVDLSTYDNKFQGKIHIERKETAELYDWINRSLKDDESRIALLVGSAGYGKSVVLKDLWDLLNKTNIPVLGIKVDKILNINSLKDIETELNLHKDIFSIFQNLLKSNSKVVLLIDQIDALSQSLSSNRQAINIYDRLIKQLEVLPGIRIIISCRTYDLNYDPLLRAYKGKKIFRLSLLEHGQVEYVLSNIGIKIKEANLRLKEFLRIPLHLNLFCKVGSNKQFDDNITLQKLYDEIWEEYIISNNGVDCAKIVELLSNVANRMYEQQHIVVDKRFFGAHNKELLYLLHHNLLEESNTNKIQFIHQTFFDYVYARTFIDSGKSVCEWLRNIHQGLFIRSQVKQIFSYLRDLDIVLYIRELKEILLKQEYRFHLKLLLINDLGFYSNPQIQEKKLVEDCIINNPLYFRIFLESIQGPEWFTYIVKQNKFKKILSDNDEELENVIISLCIRIIWQNSQLIIDFLSKCSHKTRIIENVLIQIPESEIALSVELYKQTSSKWSQSKYYYLEKALKNNPDLVIGELKKYFDENLKTLEHFNDNYIPGEYNGTKIYADLYEQYPDKAIPYFVYVIQEIVKSKEYGLMYGLYDDLAFHLYRPDADNKECNDYKNLYDIVFYSIKNKLLSTDSSELILSLLESKYANILAIGVYYLLQNLELEIERIFKLFTADKFFISIKSSEILEFYAKELLAESYPIFSEEQRLIVNHVIMSTKKDYAQWTFETDYTHKKVYSNYLKGTYALLSMLPEEYRKKYSEVSKLYQEGYRKYGMVENEKPQIVKTYSGWGAYSQTAYEKMSFEDWRNTFIKLDKEKHSLDDWFKPTKEGNKREFKDYVSRNCVKCYPFIISLIKEKEIIVEYIIAGLEGLQAGNYDKDVFQNLCVDLINHRHSELDTGNLRGFLRILSYIVHDNPNLDKLIFDFIKHIIYTYPDREFRVDLTKTRNIGMEAINFGISSIRGTAVELITDCYLLSQYQEEIFETLEYVADNANEATRACAIYKGAWLNNLNKRRAFDLYLRLVKDFSPFLLAIPFNNGHPLLYHMSRDFRGLEFFFRKAITIEEAGKPMSAFLLNAYLHNKPKAFTLLKTLLHNNVEARQELIHIVCIQILGHEKYANKGWKIMMYLLNFNEEEVGRKLENNFSHIPPNLNSNLIKFLNRYLKSSLSKFKDRNFYDFLRKLVSDDSTQCLKWFFDSKPDCLVHDFYDKSPLNVLIEAYNGVREYEKDNSLLDKAMDTFDELLQISQYRNNHLRTFLQEIAQ